MFEETNLTVGEALLKLKTIKAMTVAEYEKVNAFLEKPTDQMTFSDVRFIEELYHEHVTPVTRSSGGRSIEGDIAKVVGAARSVRSAVRQHFGKKAD